MPVQSEESVRETFMVQESVRETVTVQESSSMQAVIFIVGLAVAHYVAKLMRFLTAVALTLVMLWVPVDGV